MEFALAETQIIVMKAIVQFVQKHLNSDLVNTHKRGEFPRDNWRKSVQMGLQSLRLPKEMTDRG